MPLNPEIPLTRRLKVFTWHVHGSYLYYLSQARCDFYIPFKPDRPPRYGGKVGPFPWGDNVHEVPVSEVKNLELDCILYQAKRHYLEDQFEILSEKQRMLPKIYLEHDPPQEHPTNTRHFVQDPGVLLVHVTDFNELMWDSGDVPTVVINHGVLVPPGLAFSGSKPRGVVVINNIKLRGRRLGLDVFERVKKSIPLDLIGMGSEEVGGLGEVPHDKLPEFLTKYRFFFNPIRYTSLGLSVCEAMAMGMPIVGLATTEMARVIQDGRNGFSGTNIDLLVEKMRRLLSDRNLALRLGRKAGIYARKNFSIQKFTRDWELTLSNWVASTNLGKTGMSWEISRSFSERKVL